MEFEDPHVPLTIEGSPIKGRTEYAGVDVVTVHFSIDVEYRDWGMKGITVSPRKGVGFMVTPIDPVTNEEEPRRHVEIPDITQIPVAYAKGDGNPGQAHASRLLLCFDPSGNFVPNKSVLTISP